MALVVAKEAARALGLNVYTLYREARAGRIPTHRIGRAVRFDLDDIKAVMRQAEPWRPHAKNSGSAA